MNTDTGESGLTLAGRQMDDAWGQVRRYCGLPWNGNPPETWAFRYFDAIETDPDAVTPVDVVCASALHPDLSRKDLAFFWDHRSRLEDWVSGFPAELDLNDADDADIEHLAFLPSLAEGTSLGLISKVLHRKRPRLIPMIDREIIDLYRPVTGHRRATDAWAPLLRCLAEDLQSNAERFAEMGSVLRVELGRPVSPVRILDIAVWMGGRK